MRILIIGINYAPEQSGNAPYTTGFAEYMAARGHEVHVLTGRPHYPEWKPQAIGEEEVRGVRNGVHVHRRWHYVPANASAMHRALYEGSFLGSLGTLFSLPRPDAIMSIVPALSDAVLGRIASRRFHAPYGVLFQDLMGKAAAQSGIAGGSKVEKLVSMSERWVVRGASGIGIVSDAFRPYLEEAGAAPDSVFRVHNWRHVPPAATSRAEVRKRLGWPNDAIVCLHAGNMGHKQGLDNIVASAEIARQTNGKLLFVMAGDGNQRSRLEDRAALSGLTNLRFYPSQSSQDYADMLAAADVLLLSQNGRVTDMAFPSKLASYLSSGRPILAAVSAASHVAKELTQARAALVVAAGKPEDILHGIERLSSDELLRRRLKRSAGIYAQRFSREDALQGLEQFAEHIYRGTEKGRRLQEAA